jgi:3-oxoacyl-[acyl-carrier protein] reductase
MIFGGGRGIGKTLAEYFVSHGHDVSVAGRNRETLALFKGSMARQKLCVNTVKTDIGAESQVLRAFSSHKAKWGKSPDVVINCAAVQGPIGHSWSLPACQWEDTIRTNLLGSFMVSQIAVKEMTKKGRGSIIMFSGGGAVTARENFSAYSISKTGVLRMVEGIAEELKTAGYRHILINAIAPGAVSTGMTREILKAGKKAGKQALVEAAKVVEHGGTPASEIIKLVDFLIDVKKNKGLTGRLIHVREDYQGLIKRYGKNVPDEIGKIRRIPIK